VARQGNGSAPEYGAIGGHLREVRVARGLSLRALAERVGVSPSLISQVETGRARPSVRTLYAIASELRISLDELLFPDAAQEPVGPIEAEGSASPDVPTAWRSSACPSSRSSDRGIG
jgi:transcriptional regulator with XRE-family HTH domain